MSGAGQVVARPISGRLERFIRAIQRIYLIVVVAALTLPAHAWADAICANPGSSGAGTISGVVNEYFQGNGNLASGATTLTLGTRDSRGANATLVNGDLLLVIQMQDGEINPANSNLYGDGSGSGMGTTTAGNAGLHDFVTVTNAGTGVAGSAITFAPALANNYKQLAATTTSGQKRYQVIRVPQYTSATAAGIIAPAWGFGTGATGETGGVAVVDVRDTLTLGSATVEGQTNRAFFLAGKGFRGGAGDSSAANNGSNLDWVTLASSSTPPAAPVYLAHGGKGEGIAGTPRFFATKDQWGFQLTNDVTSAANLFQIDYGNAGVYAAGIEGYPGGSHARGAPGNAGGGGTDGRNPDQSNDENAGGGGGGNYAAGGLGGRPWNAPLVDSDGRGGAGYAGTVAFNRVILGGGGGSGSTNNATADPAAYTNQAMGCSQAALCSSGAAGGGIVIIRARAITGTGIIDVRGAHAYNVLNDSGGGGGAGGSVVLYTIDGGNASINAAGGDGGNAWAGNQSGTGNRHGPGGGGGGGFVAFAPQTMSVNAILDGGTPGITTNGTDTYSSSGNIGGLSTFQTPNTPGTIPGALCAPDLHLKKSDGVTSVTPGQALTYTVTVTNAASVATTASITVVDVLPAQLVYTGATTLISGNFTCTYTLASSSLSCVSTTPIAAMGTDSFSFPAMVPSLATAGDLTNQAQVGGGGDPNKPAPTVASTQTCTANDTPAGCAVDVDALQSPLLVLTKSDGADVVIAGAATTYSLVVTNSGSASTSTTLPIQVVDILPTGLVYSGPATFTSGGFSCTFASPSFTCTTSTPIAAAGSATITIPVTVSATAPGALTNLAQVGGGGDPGKTTLPTPTSTAACPAPVPPATTSSDPSSGCAGDTDAVKHVNLTMTKDDGVPYVLVGGTTTYTYTVSNNGDTASVGTIFFRDELPAGLTWPATLTVGGTNGANWTCVLVGASDTQGVTCTSTTAIAAGGTSKFSLIVNATGVTNGTQYVNRARIAGGSDADLLPGPLTAANVTSCISNNNPAGCALDLDTASQAIIRLAKTHTGTTFLPGATVPFTLAVTNSGGLSSGGANTVQVIDVLPTTLTFAGATPFTSGTFTCSVAGQVITCNNNAAITAGQTLNITFSAMISATATNSVVNPAQVGSTGGADPSNNTLPTTTTAGACTGTDAPTVGCAVDTVPLASDLTIAKSHAGNFTQGQTGATYSLTVKNSGSGPTTGTVTVVDTLPTGLTATNIAGTGWTCTLATLTCTRTDALAVGATYPVITVTVNVASNAPASVTNNVAVSGGGESNTGNDTASDPTTITQVPDLTIVKSHTGNFFQSQTGATYSIVVTNSGSGPTTGTVSVTDTLPTGLTATAITGGGWTCTLGTLTCTRTDALASGASYPAITVTVNVASNAPASVTNSATVSGGGETVTTNDTSTDPTTITQEPDLVIAKTHTGNFSQGQIGATYTLIVSNIGSAATSGTVAVADTLPASLTATAIAGTGWTCTLAPLMCTRADALAAGASYPAITVTVNVSATAPATVINTAGVSGGGEIVTTNDSATDSTTITGGPDLTITKSHTGNFTQGQTGATYSLIVKNIGATATTGTVSVVDTLPTGLTATAITGTGWTCTLGTLTCTRTDALAAGASYPTITLTVNVANNAPASVTNNAAVSGGGEVVTTNDTATDPTTITGGPDLTITKTHTGNFTQGQTGATYAVTVTNSGATATTGTVTVVDTLPTGLTATNITGTGWTCTLGTLTCTRTDALAAGTSYPPITITVNVANNAPTSVTNSVTVSGGGEVNTTNDTATDPTTINGGPDLTITKSHTGNFSQGQMGAIYTLSVKNIGATATTGTVTVVDTLPTGLTATNITGTGWTCVLGTLTCTRSDALAAGASYPDIMLTVNVSNTAPANVTNTAVVSGGGEVVTTNDTATDPTTIATGPDLTITKTHTGNFSQGQTGAIYTVTVSNAGATATSGTVSIVDTLPTGLTATNITGTGWTCTLGTLTCTRTDALAGGASYPPITITVNVANNASSPLVNSVTVSGGGEVVTTNDTATDSTIISGGPDLTITKTHTGNFSQGQTGATYSLVVKNIGATATTGTVTVVDTLPTGLTATNITGTGWTCTLGTLTCTRTDALAAGASYPTITLTVNVANTAPANVTNNASVSGGGEVVTTNDSATDPTTINAGPDLTIVKSHTGNFSQGQTGATYSVIVTNSGATATSGTVTVVDTLPTGLTATNITGTGWTCTLGTLTCTRTDALAAGMSYPAITITVNVANNASSPLVNSATVSGGGEVVTTNDTATDSTTINNGPDLTITKTHTGNFTQGQTGATYSVTVTNSGATATSGTVTIVDTLPTGLTATNIAGTGWTCTLGTLTCTRTDALAPSTSYPVITVTVNVANNAPANVTNSVTVSGGGEVVTTNDTATDPTTITGGADLTIAKTHTGNFTQGQTGATYTLAVKNIGATATTGTVSVVDTLPTGLTATAIAGTGWTCTLGTLTCTRSDALAAGASYPNIIVTVNVSNTAPTNVTNTAVVSGGGEVVTTNDTATDPTTIGQTSSLSITKDDGSATYIPGGTATYDITVTNAGPSTATNVTVSDSLPPGVTLAGTPTCTVNGLGACGTLSGAAGDSSFGVNGASVGAAAGDSLVFHVPVLFDSALTTASISNTATVSAPSDPSPHTATDTDGIAAHSSLAVTKTDGSNFYTPGNGAVYSITVINNGPSDAHAVNVSDVLPAGVTVAGTASCAPSGTATCGTVGGTSTTVTVTGGGIGAGAGNALVITVPVQFASSMTTNPLVNSATATDPADPAGPATGTDTDTLAASSGLSIAKSDGSATYTAGGTAVYTVTVLNAGPSDANAVGVTDTLPAGVTLTGTPTCVVNGTATCGTIIGVTGGSNFTVGGATIASGAGNSLVYSLPVAFASNLTTNPLVNTASVTDPSDPGSHTGSDSDTPKPVTALNVTKTDGMLTYTPGSTATYTITVTNAGPSNSTGVDVNDALPAGVTLTGAPACVTLGTATCGSVAGISGSVTFSETGGAIAAGAGNALIFTVPVQFAAGLSANPLINTASAADDTGAPPATGTDSDTLQSATGLTITKDDGNVDYTPGGGAVYTITLTNAGPSNANNVTVIDPLPAGVTLSAAPTCITAGTASCGTLNGTTGGGTFGATGVQIAAGAANSVTFLVPVDYAPDLTSDPLANTVSATDNGSGQTVQGTDSDKLKLQTSLIITKDDGQASYTPGGTATYVITVANGGPSDATGVSVTDALPAGVTLTGVPTCIANGAATCGTVTGVIGGTSFSASGATVDEGAGNSLMFSLPVAFATNLSTNPLVNSASASDASGAPPVTGTDSDSRMASSGFTITKTDGSATYTAGGTATYTIVVSNAGPSDADAVMLTDNLPTGVTLTGTPTCTPTGLADCGTITGASGGSTFGVTAGALPVGNTLTYSVPVAFASNLTANPVVNTVTVSDVNIPGSTQTATDSDTPSAQADLSITKTDNATSYTPGTPVTYTIVAHNAGPSDVSGATVSDPLPTNITTAAWTCVADAGAICAATGSGAITDIVTLPSGTSVTYMLTLTVPSTFTGNLTNTATITAPAGVTDSNPNNNTATDTDTQGAQPDLTVVKSHTGDFTQGQNGAMYTITVSNVGGAPSTGLVTVVDTLPTGLIATAISGTGWSCTLATLTCTRSDALAGGSAYADITVTVNVAANAPASVTNSATVSGGGDPNSGNNTSDDPTTILTGGEPDLTIVKSHVGNFAQGQTGASYSIVVSNIGTASTSGTVTVTDTLPAGLTATAISGTGWTCTLGTLTCTRSDVLTPTQSYPAITLLVDVAANATASVTNIANVGGGGDNTPGNDSSSDPTTITTTTPPQAVLTIVKTGPATTTAGGTITYSIVVRNTGTGAATDATLSDTPPAQLTFVSATTPCTGGLPCNLGTLNPGQSVTVSVRFNVAAGFTGQIVNTASVTSDQTTQTSSSSSSTVNPAAPPGGTVAVPIDARWMLLAMIGLLAGFGWRTARKKVR